MAWLICYYSNYIPHSHIIIIKLSLFVPRYPIFQKFVVSLCMYLVCGPCLFYITVACHVHLLWSPLLLVSPAHLCTIIDPLCASQHPPLAQSKHIPCLQPQTSLFCNAPCPSSALENEPSACSMTPVNLHFTGPNFSHNFSSSYSKFELINLF